MPHNAEIPVKCPDCAKLLFKISDSGSDIIIICKGCKKEKRIPIADIQKNNVPRAAERSKNK